jgi:hypothetical protein
LGGGGNSGLPTAESRSTAQTRSHDCAPDPHVQVNKVLLFYLCMPLKIPNASSTGPEREKKERINFNFSFFLKIGYHKKRERARNDADRRGPPIRGGQACAGDWASWAEMAFSFSWNFLIAFLFIFSRVFQFKFKPIFKLNQYKHVHQFK